MKQANGSFLLFIRVYQQKRKKKGAERKKGRRTRKKKKHSFVGAEKKIVGLIEAMAAAATKKTPASKAADKGITRHGMWWYPKRCEHDGCDASENLMKCSGCSMVMYCGREHQSADWSSHKGDCKVFQRNKVKGFFYTDEDMMSRFRMRPPGSKVASSLPRDSCGICYSSPGEKPMTITECCRHPICDTEANYQMFSYSREFCSRSHRRYTLCGNHGVESSCDTSKDWRECNFCINENFTQMDDKLWRGLNPYNFCPLLSKDVPRHSLCATCAKCGKKFMSGLEGSSMSFTKDQGMRLTCTNCSYRS